jgi:hypothetical protein
MLNADMKCSEVKEPDLKQFVFAKKVTVEIRTAREDATNIQHLQVLNLKRGVLAWGRRG